jgi:hypothetical protein
MRKRSKKGLRRRYGRSRTKRWSNGTRVRVKAPFEVRAWTGKIVDKQGPPHHEKVRFLIEPDHGGASLWRRPSEFMVLP